MQPSNHWSFLRMGDFKVCARTSPSTSRKLKIKNKVVRKDASKISKWFCEFVFFIPRLFFVLFANGHEDVLILFRHWVLSCVFSLPSKINSCHWKPNMWASVLPPSLSLSLSACVWISLLLIRPIPQVELRLHSQQRRHAAFCLRSCKWRFV